MKKIKLFSVVFDAELLPHEIPTFRGAVIEKVGRESLVYHNHLEEGYLYRYPLIQYKSIGKRPAIVCLDAGADELYRFFQKSDWSVRIGERHVEMPIYKLNMEQVTVQVADQEYRYRLFNWIALNQDNYKVFMDIKGLTERIRFLERIMVGNIISFAKGISWDVDRQIRLNIEKIDEPRQVRLKGRILYGFNPQVLTNVILPENIGLGKGVSKGYGIVTLNRQTNFFNSIRK